MIEDLGFAIEEHCDELDPAPNGQAPGDPARGDPAREGAAADESTIECQ